MKQELEGRSQASSSRLGCQLTQLAEHFFKSGSKELISMARVSAFIEAFKYAIRVKSISEVGKMITTRFAP